MPSGHSGIGASGMYRWQNCPGSRKLAATCESRSSVYAAEGSVAHRIAEDCLREDMNPADFLGRVIEQEGFAITVDAGMIDAVAAYLDYVRGRVAVNPEHMQWSVEHRFHMPSLHEDLYGTADCVLFDPTTGHLEVIDYKHGAGIAVEVEGNTQGLYYALGAARSPEFAGVKRVTITIVQPRCFHADGPIRSWDMDIVDLIDWEADLMDAVAATEQPDAPLRLGEWCRFCPAAHICPAAIDKAQTLAEQAFAKDAPPDGQKLADALKWAKVMDAWAKRVHEIAYAEAENGNPPPGYKLVAKQPRRHWIDAEAAVKALVAFGMAEDAIYGKDLRSPAQIEKALGVDKILVAPFIEKKSSGHTLVEESDPRSPVKETAEQAFSALSSD